MKQVDFTQLPAGTALETAKGPGVFLRYKEGNFRQQNVLIEHHGGRQLWHTEESIRQALKQAQG